MMNCRSVLVVGAGGAERQDVVWRLSPGFLRGFHPDSSAVEFMAQVCMRRGGWSLGRPARGPGPRAAGRGWPLPAALSAPARARPGRPGAGAPGPCR